MPIQITPLDHGTLCHGHSWSVNDKDALAYQIAQIAVGKSKHVQRILSGVLPSNFSTSVNAKSNAIKMLTVEEDSDPWHRDGWMFQAMSWIAAHKKTPGGIIRAPHMILAHKGFDGLQLILNEGRTKVISAIIFEDKATNRPRATIQNQVWPDFVKLDSGDRENVLASDVSSMLEGITGIDPDEAINKILWKRARKYRLSITVKERHLNISARKRLFKGYNLSATGTLSRRQAETIFIPNLRAWMQDLADRAINQIEEM